MFIVAIIPLMFSPGDDTGVFKSIRWAGTSADPVNGPGALLGEERWTAALLPLAELSDDDVEEPASICPTEAEFPSLCGLFLLLLLLDLPPLLG